MKEAFAMASHNFSTKDIGIFEKLTYENFNEMLTNDVVSFEQLGPELYIQTQNNISISMKIFYIHLPYCIFFGYNTAVNPSLE